MNSSGYNVSKAMPNVRANANVRVTTPTPNMFNNAYERVSSVFGGKTGIIIAFILLMLVFLLVIIFIVSQLRNNAYKKGKALTTQIINLGQRNDQIEIPGADLPKQTMGEQYTLSFWLYLEDLVQTNGFHKMILYRGEKDNVQTANPMVFMDHITNTLYFVLQPKGESLTNVPGANYDNLLDITKNNYYLNSNSRYADQTTNRHIVIPVSNVPFNRWVHVALVVKDNVITTLLDGKANVSTVNDILLSRTPTMDDPTPRPENPPILNNNLNGSIFVGKSPVIGGGYGVSGYLSKLGFYNYAMTLQEVSQLINQGPMNSNLLMTAFGANRYSIRNPFYRLDTVKS